MSWEKGQEPGHYTGVVAVLLREGESANLNGFSKKWQWENANEWLPRRTRSLGVGKRANTGGIGKLDDNMTDESE